MKTLLLFLLIPAGAFGQALSYIPPSIGLFYSSDGSGASGTWDPLTGSGGSNPLTYVPPTMGMYYSNDGTGNINTWVPCSSSCIGGGGGGGGTVTSFSAGNLSPLFTTSVATPTATPALTFSLSTAAANSVFGNATGSTAAPTFTSTPSVISLTTTGTTAGFVSFGQGSTNAAGTTNITEQAPTAVTSYVITKPGTAATGIMTWTNASGVVTESLTPTSGTGNVCLTTSCTMVTPVLGIATGTSVQTSSNIVSTAGNIVANTGNITATAGAVTAGHGFINTPTTITASATPAITASNGLQTITLNANSTPTVTAIAAGQMVTFEICQPATGGPFTWTWPAAIHGGLTIGTAASTCSLQSFVSYSGTTLVATGPGVTGVAP